MKTRITLLITALAMATACDKSSPTTPAAFTPLTEVFAGSIDSSGSPFYSFTVSESDWVGVTFASETTTTSGSPVGTNLKLGLGIPSGTGCAASTSVMSAPGLSAQISRALDPGVYCVDLVDASGLTDTTNFVVRIAQTAAAPTGMAASATDTFTSNLLPGETATHQLSLTNAGVLTTTVTTTPAASSIGLAIGVVVAGECRLTQSTTLTSGSGNQISLPIDAGSYCVKVFDPGTLTGPITFSAAIAHP